MLDTKTLIVIAISLANVLVLVSIKFNDLKHLTKDVKKMDKKLDSLGKRLYNHAQRISKLEGIDSKK